MKGTVLASWDNKAIYEYNGCTCYSSFNQKNIPVGEMEVVNISDVKVGESIYTSKHYTSGIVVTSYTYKEDSGLVLMNKICQDKRVFDQKEKEILELKEQIASLKQDLELYKSTKEFIDQSVELSSK